MDAPLKSLRALSGGISTGYLEAGAGNPVILLHGMGSGARFWQPVMAGMAVRFRVIAPDLAGFGGSSEPPRDNIWPSYPSWLLSFMDRLGIAKACIVGHSMGGAIALRFSLDFPERVSRLVLVDSIGLGAVPLTYLSAIMFTLPSNPVSRAFLRRVLALGPLKTALPNAVKKTRGASYDRKPVKRLLRASGWRGLPRVPFKELENVRHPTLLLWGEHDAVLPLWIAKRACALIPGASLRTIDAGHAPPLERPEDFCSKLMDFLAAGTDAESDREKE
jgi:pimeloyl-ACP methyl ester carboxylesterase